MGGDATSKIQSALQSQFPGVTVSTDEKGNIELNGKANSAQERKEAVKIAKENANGKKVKNHIKVSASANSSNNSGTPNSH